MAAGRRIGLVIAILLMAAGCAQRQAALPPVPMPAPQPGPGMHMWPNRDAIQSACLNDLAATGAQFELIAQAEPGKNGCTLVNGVKLTRTTVPLNRPVEMTCPMALRYMQFEQTVLQPEAQRLFGRPLGQVNHAGGFTCRRMTGGGGRLSEHAHGRAFDIWGFTLSDGTRLSVKDHFRARGAIGEYLRNVSRQACRYFSVVLGPNGDANHQDHFHWDIGPWPRCGG